MRSPVACILVFFANSALATEAANRTPELAGSSVAMQVLTGLGFVTCSIFALAWLAKRLGGANLIQQSGMNVISSMPVGTREKIVLLNVNNTNILLGVTAQNISSLHVFDKDEKLNPELAGTSERLKSKSMKWDFAQYIKQVTAQGVNLKEISRQAKSSEAEIEKKDGSES